jgi:hypothetical protein
MLKDPAAPTQHRDDGVVADPPSGAAISDLQASWMPIRHAADHLGVSIDTIRRRIKANRLNWRRDARGQYQVAVPVVRAPPSPRGTPIRAVDNAGLRICEAALEEVRVHRDALLRQVEAQQRLLEAHAKAEAEFLRLLEGFRGRLGGQASS